MRRPWWNRMWMKANNWWRRRIGVPETCYWCGRTFLARSDHRLTTETQADLLCSEECMHEYARIRAGLHWLETSND